MMKLLSSAATTVLAIVLFTAPVAAVPQDGNFLVDHVKTRNAQTRAAFFEGILQGYSTPILNGEPPTNVSPAFAAGMVVGSGIQDGTLGLSDYNFGYVAGGVSAANRPGPPDRDAPAPTGSDTGASSSPSSGIPPTGQPDREPPTPAGDTQDDGSGSGDGADPSSPNAPGGGNQPPFDPMQLVDKILQAIQAAKGQGQGGGGGGGPQGGGGGGGQQGGPQGQQSPEYQQGYQDGYNQAVQDQANAGAANEGGANEGGANEGGANEGGANEGGANEGGANEGGANEGGANEGGANEGGASEGGANEGGANEGGANEGGANEGGANEGGDQEESAQPEEPGSLASQLAALGKEIGDSQRNEIEKARDEAKQWQAIADENELKSKNNYYAPGIREKYKELMELAQGKADAETARADAMEQSLQNWGKFFEGLGEAMEELGKALKAFGCGMMGGDCWEQYMSEHGVAPTGQPAPTAAVERVNDRAKWVRMHDIDTDGNAVLVDGNDNKFTGPPIEQWMAIVDDQPSGNPTTVWEPVKNSPSGPGWLRATGGSPDGRIILQDPQGRTWKGPTMDTWNEAMRGA